MQSEQDWRYRAACKGPQANAFFPPARFERKEEKRRRELRAKMICSSCAVQEDCLSYSLRIREQHGIWGGKNEQERRAILPV